MDILRFCWCAVWVIGTVNIWGARVAGVWDEIVFGQPSSERRHGFSDKATEIVRGGMEEPARVLLPVPGERVEGSGAAELLHRPFLGFRQWEQQSVDIVLRGKAGGLPPFGRLRRVGYRQ